MTYSWRQHSAWRAHFVALFLGILVPLSLAPFNLWPLGMMSASALALLLTNISIRQRLVRSFFFGLGMFTTGASWVYVSIHDFGMTSAPLAVLLTTAFVLGLAFLFALPFVFYSQHITRGLAGKTLGFAAVWTLGEWSRTWLLTGFPWLYLGYGHVSTWLSGWGPVLGVFGLSFLCLASGTLLSQALLFHKARHPLISTAAIIFTVITIWVSGLLLSHHRWQIENSAEPISVAIVQPNIPLAQKWNPLYRDEIMHILRSETGRHWDKDLIVWPEAALPLMYHDAEYFLSEVEHQAQQTNTGIILGVLYDDEQPMTFYNSIIGLGRASGIYFKQRLVPFGEYVPLEQWLRGLITFFDLPNSIIFPGPKDQEILGFDEFKIAPSICYEIVYPDLVARQAKNASLLVTISNDAWFGDSIGPDQHFQMTQMRALENRRYVLRSTNTGISGIINPQGQVTLLGNQFVQETIEQLNITPTTTATPFSLWGSRPIVIFCVLTIILLTSANTLHRRQNLTPLPG